MENLPMSGSEVAGAVLGTIPLVISALEKYNELTKQFRSSSNLSREYKIYQRKLAVQRVIFINNLRQLLVPLVADNETIQELLSSPGEGWRDPYLASLLKKRFGDAYPFFLECIERIGRVVGDIHRELFIDSGDSAESSRRLIQLGRHAFGKKALFERLFSELRDCNNDLETLLHRHIKFEAQLASRDEKYSSTIGKLLDLRHEDSEMHERLRRLRPQFQRVHETFKIHDENVTELLPGSGKWFLRSAEYNDWVARPGTTLFTPGIPGSGKSTMMSIVLNDLRRRLGPDARLAWVWFDPARRGQGEEGHTLHSIIADLALLLCFEYTSAGNSLPASVVQLLEDMADLRLRATTADLSHILQVLGAPASRVFLLFDAVETASETVRATMMPQIQDLQDSLGLNIFATALLGSGIDELFPSSISLEIRASAEDVSSYIRRGLNSDRRLRRLVDGAENEGLRHEIIQTTVDMSDGMFLFARLTLASLTRSASRRDMLAELKDSSKVDFLYEKLASRLQTEPNGWERVLPFTALSKMPLGFSQLRHAVAAEKGHSDFTDDSLVDLENIAISSRGLLVFRHRDGVPILQFCHWTAADFYKRREAGSADDWPLRIARTCLHYLSLPAFATGPQDTDEQYRQRVASYPFYEYASRYWAAHFKDVVDPAASSALQEQALTFLANRASVASSAQALMRATPEPAPADMNALSLVAYLDLPTIAQSLLAAEDDEQGFALMARVDSLRRTALLWAACGGAASVARVLLERGCSLNDPDKSGDTALSLTASLGHTDVARVLLESGADSEVSARPPLTLAAEGGYRDLVRMLLDHGADHRRLLENGDSALHRAAANGHSEVVQVLLYHFTEDGLLQHQNQNGQTPLFAAASHGQADVVKILLAAGADARIADPTSGHTPLLRAVVNQHWSVIQALLASEADLGSYDPVSLLEKAVEREGWEAIDLLLHRTDAGLPTSTPGRLLCQAAREGKESVVKRLVERYPDAAHTSDGEGQLAPLAWAARGGHVGVVRVLLQHGGDVNWKDGEDKTALVRAIEAGQDEVATVLLEVSGVDTSPRDPDSTTLLALASREGMLRTVRRLLALDGTDPDAVNKAGHTALSLAAGQGHVETVRELLQSGLASLKPSGDAEAQNPLFCAVRADQSAVVSLLAQRDDVADLVRDVVTGRTALSLACERGGLQSAKALLFSAKGSVNPNMADSDGKTPLCWAAEKGHDAVVQHLIGLKADVNARTEEGWTPLHYAAKSGSGTVVNALLGHANANAAAEDGTTPLVAALQAGPKAQAVFALLLSYDYASLHGQVQRGNDAMVRRLLDAGYDVNTTDLWGRTALHAVVTSEGPEPVDMAKALLASDPKPDLTIEDVDGLTPVRLALRESQLRLVKLFLETSAGLTRNISAEDWLQAYGDPSGTPDRDPWTIRVQERAGEGTEVACLSERAFSDHLRTSPDSASPGRRRLL